MRYSFAVGTAALASATLTSALPTASSLLSSFDTSITIPAFAQKVLGNWWGEHQQDGEQDGWKGLSVSQLYHDGVDCEFLPCD